jgi:hypothetical protein
VVAVVGIEEDRCPHSVRDEGVVTPSREQLSLLAGQAGATHHEPVPVSIGALGHFGLATEWL